MSTRYTTRWPYSSATVALAVAALAALSTPTAAQIPGVPVLQNAFANPGLAFAANFGGGSGQNFYGVAAGWGIGGRFTLSGGAGAQRMANTTRGAYGARAAMSVWNSSGGALGAGGFVGFGAAPRTCITTAIFIPRTAWGRWPTTWASTAATVSITWFP